MTRKRLGLLLIVVSVLPFVGQIAGLLAIGTAGCTGPECAWLSTLPGRIAGTAVNAGAWVMYTAPLGVIGLILMIIEGMRAANRPD
ncbi:hypothetical protein [Aliiroseovarius sp.]|uniref:hypothetical protein n=1 Tax=Aliiroseovarius sp. TaxID=1872442 RepID=UPI002637D989|nr:hypothetical protein [Aliiroseovarius sp.]